MSAKDSEAVIDEIRHVRHRISERFDHDPDRLVRYYMELQRRYQDRLIEVQETPEGKKSSVS